MTRRTFASCLAVIFFAGLALRVLGTGWGNPHGYHYDERFVLEPAVRITQTGNANPEFFNYPSGLIYLTSAIVGLHHQAGMALDLPTGPGWGPADLDAATWPALRDGRRMVAFIGALGILAAALLALETGGRAAAIIAAMLVAALALHAEHSHFLTTDIPMTTFVTLAFATGARRGGVSVGALSGAMLGLAIAMKYTAGFALLPLLVTNALAGGGRNRVIATLPAAAAVFIAVCPFVLLDWQNFLADLAVVRSHYQGGHLGAEGAEGEGNWGWYLSRLAVDGIGRVGLGLIALGWIGVAWDLLTRCRDSPRADAARKGAVIAAIVALTALLWFLWLGSVRVRFERNLLPAATLAVIAAAHGLACITARMPARRWVAIGLALLLAPPLALAARRTSPLAGEDTRSVAGEWIEENIPPGSSIVREEYTPRPDPERYRVRHIWSLTMTDPMVYRSSNIDYVILSSAVHSRFAKGDPSHQRYRRIMLWPIAAQFVPDPDTAGPIITVREVPRLDGKP